MCYKLTEETRINSFGVKLYRIERTEQRHRDDIKVGAKGGWVEGKNNLTSSEAWIFDNAEVFGNANISGRVSVCGNSQVFGNAILNGLNGRILIRDTVKIFDSAKVSGFVSISGNSVICGSALINGDKSGGFLVGIFIRDFALISDNAEVKNCLCICGHAHVGGHSHVGDKAHVGGHAVVKGNAEVCGYSVVVGDTKLLENEFIKEYGSRYDAIMDASVYPIEKINQDYLNELWMIDNPDKPFNPY